MSRRKRFNRRQFTAAAAGVTLGFAGLQRFVHGQAGNTPAGAEPAFGPLRPDPDGLFDLPDGFSYRVLSRTGDEMDDGLLVPGMHDGSAALPGPNGTTALIRNHELTEEPAELGAFGPDYQRLSKVPRRKLYDAGAGGDQPVLGATTTLIYDTKRGRLERQFLSLAGTGRNCAGGPTPWGSWLSCEEWTRRADDRVAKDHGYVFEVPADTNGLVEARPLRQMGRFWREAVAVDPRTGIVYMSEDQDDGLLYRFVPNEPGNLAAGGRVDALAVADWDSLDMRNWDQRRIEVGRTMPVRWIPMDRVEAPDDDLRLRGFERGAARFARGEGMWWGRGAAFLACTSGGANKLGQIWRYVPGRREGQSDEDAEPGRIELFVEPRDGSLVQNADNLTVAPWGDLFVCEDSPGEDRLVRITPGGEISHFGRNRLNDAELAGATFSPDGSTLFVNIQTPGLTLAITGPWPNEQRG